MASPKMRHKVVPTSSSQSFSKDQCRKEQFRLTNRGLIVGILEEQQRKATRIDCYDADPDSVRGRVRSIVQHRLFNVTVSLIVVMNAAYIGLETEVQLCEETSGYDTWYLVQAMFAFTFSFELGLRLFAERRLFWKDPWNVFDTLLVTTSVSDVLVLRHLASGSATLDLLLTLRFLRLVRLARIFRLIRFCKELWYLVEGALSAVRTLAWAWLLILLMTYIPAIFVTQAIGRRHPDNVQIDRRFGTVPKSMYTLFQVMSMEGWADVARLTMTVAPWSWIFFILFIFSTTFAIMHVVVAVIVQNTLEHASNRQSEVESLRGKREEMVLKKIFDIFEAADVDGDGELTQVEFLQSLENPSVIQHLHEVDVDVRQAENLFDILDFDESGSLNAEEFIEGLMTARGEAKAKEVLAVQCDMWKVERKLQESMQRFDKEVHGAASELESSIRAFRQQVPKVPVQRMTTSMPALNCPRVVDSATLAEVSDASSEVSADALNSTRGTVATET